LYDEETLSNMMEEVKWLSTLLTTIRVLIL
jgi:hypothetical protein